MYVDGKKGEQPRKPVTVPRLLEMKNRKEKITMLTAYDSSFAYHMEEAGVDLVLVGDSLGMVIQGRSSTLPVTADDIIYHCSAVSRSLKSTLLIADLPFRSLMSVESAVNASVRFLSEGNAAMVKLEGSAPLVLSTIRALVERSIPVCAHLGLTPQSVHALGGYKVQGKSSDASEQIRQAALAVQEAGASLLVLECVPETLAQQITQSIRIPTIGIGAGVHCDGQVLVVNLFIVSAKRTAFGTFGGSLKSKTATDLAEHAARAAIGSAQIKPEKIDHVIFGNVIQSSKDAAYLARTVGLRVEVPIETPAVTTNRLCGSGFEAIIEGARQILVGDSKVVLAGGTECMSQSPFVVRGTRFGVPLGSNVEFEDALWQGLTDQHIKTPMGITAENLGEKYGITRQEVDEYALKSQNRWRLANNAGYFKKEIEALKLKSRKGEIAFEVDEHPRETTIESLQKLPPVFKKNGLVTAGTASGVSDGAAAVVLASGESVQELKLDPLVRLVGWKTVGCDPSIMGIGPVGAIQCLLKTHELTLDDIELIEVNEAFAAQVLAVQKELKIESDKLNVNGGAISLGHPLGASGARITAHLAHELVRRKGKYAIGSACIGGGQGIAVLIERV
ncbi:3-ketoacyl-CoA thiolase, mitochondrial [Aphelenchoides besseyi]|nr:3-ketoacyl-CoA thiolase, mitochondrial [Aphelenchoides besseyi]KAI6210377.1 3-ketoacyl-CoA thiolase, mitochondrial [Aphelenchoides besseyi]